MGIVCSQTRARLAFVYEGARVRIACIYFQMASISSNYVFRLFRWHSIKTKEQYKNKDNDKIDYGCLRCDGYKINRLALVISAKT